MSFFVDIYGMCMGLMWFNVLLSIINIMKMNVICS